MSNEKTLKKHSIKDDFSMLAILTIPVCVAVNFVGGQLASLLKLPMYLDVIGTIFSAMLCGPWVAAVVGAITNLLTSIANPVNLPFIIVNVVVGLTTGWMSRANMFSCWWKTAIALVLQAIISTVVSAPIVVLVYGGVTGSGTSLLWQRAPTSGPPSSAPKASSPPLTASFPSSSAGASSESFPTVPWSSSAAARTS